MNEEKIDNVKVVEAIEQILQSSLSHALNNCYANLPETQIPVILPIALSRFAYRELLIMSRITGLDIDKMKKVFIKLFENLSELNVDEIIMEEIFYERDLRRNS